MAYTFQKFLMSDKLSKFSTAIILLCIVYSSFLITIMYFKTNEKNFQNISELSVNAINQNYKSVVTIIAKLNDYNKNPLSNFVSETKKNYIGSGLILDESGYLVTNYHVIEDASEILVKLYNGEVYKVLNENIFVDKLTDIAVLKINANKLYPAKVGNSDTIEVGQDVIALGNPIGLFDISNKLTATKGIISAKKIDFGFNEDFERTYKDMIQTDASINPGNSGGPLINLAGDVIGLNTFVISGDKKKIKSIGLNFAIPINRVFGIYQILVKDGFIDREFSTGITVREIDQVLMKFFRLESSNGVLVIDVEKKSSGEVAGIKIGDIILKVSGKDVNSLKDIRKIINGELLKTGDKIKVIVLRNNVQIELNLSLVKGGIYD
mgnify:CR=1 FL=1